MVGQVPAPVTLSGRGQTWPLPAFPGPGGDLPAAGRSWILTRATHAALLVTRSAPSAVITKVTWKLPTRRGRGTGERLRTPSVFSTLPRTIGGSYLRAGIIPHAARVIQQAAGLPATSGSDLRRPRIHVSVPGSSVGTMPRAPAHGRLRRFFVFHSASVRGAVGGVPSCRAL